MAELVATVDSTFAPTQAFQWHAITVLVYVSSLEHVGVWARSIKAVYGDRVDLSEFEQCLCTLPATLSVTIYRPGVVSLGPSLFSPVYAGIE